MDKLDPFQFSVLYQLFRESTRSVNGKIIKVRSNTGDLVLFLMTSCRILRT